MQEEVENRTLTLGSQRNKVHRAAAESRHHQVPCPPQGKEAAKAEKP